MQDIAIFDLVIVLITLLLGLKGLFKGFIREVFGIIGIIGGIFIASRISSETGNLINNVLAISNQSTIKLIGFITALVGIWLIVYSAGLVVSKIFNLSGLGIIDRFFGFLFGMGKIFLIFSVIAYALSQVHSFKKVIDEKFNDSIIMPYLLEAGSFIIKIDSSSIIEKIDNATSVITNEPSSVSDAVKELNDKSQNIKEDIEQNIQEELQSQAIEHINSMQENTLNNENQNNEENENNENE